MQRPVLGTSFSALTFGTNKTNSEAPYLLGAVGNPLRIDWDSIPQMPFFVLPPNVASEGRRSAQRGGVRSKGWLGVFSNLIGPAVSAIRRPRTLLFSSCMEVTAQKARALVFPALRLLDN